MPNVSIVSIARAPVAAADKGFVAKPETYDQIYAFAGVMGWTEKPFHWVVSQWISLPKSDVAKDSAEKWLN